MLTLVERIGSNIKAMSRVKGSNFDKLVIYINSFKEGDLVFRRDLLELIYGDPHKSNTTVDKWRRQLTICEYLEDTDRPGVYRRTHERIPNWITSSNLEFEASYLSRDWYKKHDPSRIADEVL